MSASFTLVGGLAFAAAPSVRSAPRITRPRAREDGPLANPVIVVALASMTALGLADGALTLGLTARASHFGAPAASGAFLGMLSIGSVIGGLLHGSRSWRWSAWWRFRTLLACTAVLVLPLCLARNIPSTLLLAGVAGLAISALMSCQFALVHEATIQENTAEAFTWNTAALVVGIALGTFLGGLMVSPIGLSGPFLLSSTACVVACGITLLALRYRGTTVRRAADGIDGEMTIAAAAGVVDGDFR